MIFDTELTQDASYEVFDIFGKKIFKNTISKGVKNSFVNLEGYPNGIYLLKVQIGYTFINKKLIKN